MATEIQVFENPGTEQDDELASYYPKMEEMKVQELVPLSIASMRLGIKQLPKHFYLGALRDGRLRVVSPISVHVMVENEQLIVESEEFEEFGFGHTFSEAITDLQRAIAELYLTLEEEQNRLGSDLDRVWSILQQKIRRRP
jgi:hypothetical protein